MRGGEEVMVAGVGWVVTSDRPDPSGKAALRHFVNNFYEIIIDPQIKLQIKTLQIKL